MSSSREYESPIIQSKACRCGDVESSNDTDGILDWINWIQKVSVSIVGPGDGSGVGKDVGVDVGVDVGKDVGVDVGVDVGKDVGVDVVGLG